MYFVSLSHIENAPRSPSLLGVSECSRPSLADQVWLQTWLSWPCNRFGSVFLPVFMALSRIIAINGYKLLYLCPLLVLRIPWLIIHGDSFRVVRYSSSASMPMEARFLFRSGTCQTWCRVIMLSFCSWMGTSPLPAIFHSCRLLSHTMPLVPVE